MSEELNILEAAIMRARNFVNENKYISRYPPDHDMYRIILAAVLNLHEEIRDMNSKVIPGAMVKTENAQDASEVKRVNKECESCHKVMENVHPARKYCDECKKEKKQS